MDDFKLGVIKLSSAEIPMILDYWYNSDPEYIYNLGADIKLLPRRDDFHKMLEIQINTPNQLKKGLALIWTENDTPIGHNNVNQIVFGKHAFMHLHLWKAENRKKGLGTELLRLSIPMFFQELNLTQLYCEPNAYNAAPNKTLAKLGFQFIKKHRIIPGQINYEQEVNRWMFKKEDLYFL